MENLTQLQGPLTMDSRADMRNVTTILLSEDSSSSTGRADTATWAMIPRKEKHQGSECWKLSVRLNVYLELGGSSMNCLIYSFLAIEKK